MVVTFLLSEALLLFVVTLLVSGFLFASLKFCLHPWAWLGLDRHVPILFDLRSSGLEVGTWDYCFLRRRNIPASRLKDLRVYKEVVDSSERISDAVPISSIDKVQGELPSSCDATKACVGTCWRSCCMPGSGMPVAGVFLGAKVEGDLSRGPVRLTRDVWTSKEVSRLLLMAQRGRELLGLPEAASDVEAPTIPIQVIDMDGAMTFGKEGLPTISEDAVLRVFRRWLPFTKPLPRGAEWKEVCRVKLRKLTARASVTNLRKEFGIVAVAVESRDGLQCGLDVPLQTGGSVLFGFENGEEKFDGLRGLLGLTEDDEDPRELVERVWLPVYKLLERFDRLSYGLQVVLCVLLWCFGVSAVPIYAKRIFDGSFGVKKFPYPCFAAFLQLGFASVLLGCLHLMQHLWISRGKALQSQSWLFGPYFGFKLKHVAPAGVAFGCRYVTANLGLSLADNSTHVLLGATELVWVLLLAVLINKERPGVLEVLACIVSLVGNVIVATSAVNLHQMDTPFWGLFFNLLAPFVAALQVRLNSLP
eukprot:symbB.v1.2.015174.t1/scaffold1109.1/size137296/4